MECDSLAEICYLVMMTYSGSFHYVPLVYMFIHVVVLFFLFLIATLILVICIKIIRIMLNYSLKITGRSLTIRLYLTLLCIDVT